jgi:acetoin utilization deacetylase AcuC-like enzyme
MTLVLWSSSRYTFPLPEGHRFPVAKYAMLREAVIAEGIVPADRVLDLARATDEALELVHTRDYVRRFREGALDAAELRRLGFPWSEALVERSYRAVGGTIAASRHALQHGLAMNLAGGTHHAFPGHGEGYCVFNDVAVAIRALQRDGRMHVGKNYPFRKVPGRTDIELADGTGDDEYLALLADALRRVLAAPRPDVVMYLAGADPHERDRLGRLRLSFDGLARRDTMVIEACREAALSVVITIAGGYGVAIEETVRIHVETARIAARYSGHE